MLYFVQQSASIPGRFWTWAFAAPGLKGGRQDVSAFPDSLQSILDAVALSMTLT
jgi:hypothetical protein